MRITAASQQVSESANPMDARKHTQLVHAAQEFEASMLQELLKPMRGSEEEDSYGGETLGSFGTEAMAGTMAKNGGLGIAKKVVEGVEQRQRLQHG